MSFFFNYYQHINFTNFTFHNFYFNYTSVLKSFCPSANAIRCFSMSFLGESLRHMMSCRFGKRQPVDLEDTNVAATVKTMVQNLSHKKSRENLKSLSRQQLKKNLFCNLSEKMALLITQLQYVFMRDRPFTHKTQ